MDLHFDLGHLLQSWKCPGVIISISLAIFGTSEGEMWNTSAILAYSSLTLVNPWMRPVGLPWASWVWNMSLGLGYSGGPDGGGDGGGSGGAVGSTPLWLWLWLGGFCSSIAPASAALGSCGLIASPFCIGPSSGVFLRREPGCAAVA